MRRPTRSFALFRPYAAFSGLLGASALVFGCAPLLEPLSPAPPPTGAIVIDPIETADCIRTAAPRGPRELSASSLDLEVKDPALLGALEAAPAAVLRSARAAGALHPLARLLRAQEATEEGRGELLALRLSAVMRLSSIEIELAALLFEADCTGDQMEAALRQLDHRNGRQELALTIASIAVGAAAGIGAGLWDLRGSDSMGPAALGIAGGAASAGLGLGALAPKRQRVHFAHSRNLLRPILTGEDPEGLYPAFVFQLMLNPVTPGGATPREQLVSAWQRIVEEAVPAGLRARAEVILFGDGGIYDAALLDARERMYDALESHLGAFHRDLELLYRFFDALLEEPLGPRAGGR